jgi:hypothetical protein
MVEPGQTLEDDEEVFASSAGPASDVTGTVSGVTDTVRGATDNLLGGGQKDR